MPYSTFVAQEDLDRPQRTALQRALEAMTPPGLVQQGTMLRERFDALGPVRVAERTADELTGLFGRLGPISPLDVLNPARLGARAGAAAGRAVAESEAGVEAELRAGETLREFGESESGQYLQAPLAPARSTFGAMGEAYQRGRETAPGLLGAGLGALGAVPAGFGQLGEQAALGAGFTPEQAAAQGRLAGIVSPGLGGLEQGGRRLGQAATAGLGAIGAAKGALETPGARRRDWVVRLRVGLNWAQFGQPVGAVGDVLRGGANRLGRRVGRAARAEVGEGLGIAAGRARPVQAAELEAAKRNLTEWGYEVRPNGGGQWLMPDGTGVGVSARGGIMNHWEVARDAGYLPQSAGPRGQLIGEANEINAGLMQKGWIRNTGSSRSPAYEFWQADGPTRRLLERELDFADPNATAYLTQAGAGVTHRFRVQEFLDNNGDLGRTLARAVKDEHGPLPARALRSLVPSAEAGEDVLGIRRGQRLRQPPLTPEQQVQRAADGAAEQRVFDAIRALWRRGPDGEAVADELRFLSVGKGEAGEAAARELLASRGLEDVLPPPTAAGVVAETPATGEGVLGLARRATEPLMARGAVTPGERAFDVAAGTAGGVVGAVTAEEDATWQERVGRGALGASLGALGGANLRQLGRVGGRALGDEALGVSLYGPRGEVLSEVEAPRTRRLGDPPQPVDPATLRPVPAPLAVPRASARPCDRAAGPPLEAAPGVSGWGRAADVLTSAPLLRPTSIINNTLGGALRTLQRWGEESGGALSEGALQESTADLMGMAAELLPALRTLPRTFRQGGTAAVRGQLGAGSDSLVTAPGRGAQLATAGTRLNVATDEVFRRINAAGARARAAARGITHPDDVEELAGQAADFVSFAGNASRLAEFLGGYRKVLTDPNASGVQKALAAGMVSITPYVRTPERVLAATGRLLGDLPGLPLSAALSKNSLVRQAMAGNQEAKREVAGRLAMSGLAYSLGLGAFAAGQLYGAPPKDAKQRRQMEAAGVQWNTLMGVPLRPLGPFGQAMSGLGTALTAAQRTYEKGGDGGKAVEAAVNEGWRFAVEDSYLRGLSDFDVAVRQGRGLQHLGRTAADAVTRPLSGLAGVVDPFDPVEREKQGVADELVEGVPGGRFALRPRIDPATGEAVRREGSGLERLLLGSRGVAESPEARELALRGVTAREFKPQDTVYGHVQTPQARRALQETFGRYTRDYVRDTMARPDYQGATEEEQAATLRRQVGLAQQLADIEVGDRVARDPQARFELEWLRTPHYRGVEGTPDRVARQNLEIREAKQLLDEYQRRYGETPGRHRFYDEHPALIDLARRPELPERRQAEEKEAVRRRTGAPEPARDAGLLGAGNRIVPTPGFTAP